MLDTRYMEEAERKAWINKQAQRHEESRVCLERKRKTLSWRIAREFDVLVVRQGEIWLVDCKRSDNHEFIIDAYDINKLLDLANEWTKRTGVPVEARFDMWFSRTRQKNNRRDIIVSEEDRGWSIKATKTPQKITTKRVRRGDEEGRD